MLSAFIGSSSLFFYNLISSRDKDIEHIADPEGRTVGASYV